VSFESNDKRRRRKEHRQIYGQITFKTNFQTVRHGTNGSEKAIKTNNYTYVVEKWEKPIQEAK
jgi:hypothetical protein